MNDSRDAIERLCAPLRRGAAAASRAGRLALLAVLALPPCASAQAQGPSGIDRLVASDAARRLDSRDPLVRGEAALVVAASLGPAHEAKLLERTADPDPDVRQRATIALGLAATPAAIAHLERILQAVDGRTGDDAVAAAFALGLAAPDRVGTSISRTLPLFQHGSWKRQHDTLLALLFGMRCSAPAAGERDERRALRELLDDDSNRAPEVRALLLELLLPIDRTLDDRALLRVVQRGADAERHAVLQWLANRPPAENEAWVDQLAQTAQYDRAPANRAAALLALTRRHHLPALEIAARALRSGDAVECTSAVQAMLTIGGGSTRGALEQHLLEERDAERKAALFAGFAAPPSQHLADHAVALATDTRQPFATRVAASRFLANSHPERAAPLLRDLFRAGDDPRLLPELAVSLHRVEAAPTALSRLLDPPVSLPQHPLRWRALLLAGHGEAQRRMVAVLQDPSSRPADVATALASWRAAHVLAAPSHPSIAPPARLVELLR